MRDPMSLGFIGRNGAYPANQAGRHTDLIIAIGARFDDRSSSSWMPGYSWNFPASKLVHVDVDHAEIGRNYAPDLGILADARTFLRQLLAEAASRRIDGASQFGEWHAQIAGWRAEWEAFIRPNFELHATPIRPGAHRRRLPRGAARRRDHLARLGHPPQLVHAVLGGAPAADDAEHLGLLGHGLRPELDPRRQARGAGPALRVDLRRRRVHHGVARAVHRGGIRHSRGVGRVEQLRLGRDPRPAVRVLRRAARTAPPSTRGPIASPTTRTSRRGRARRASKGSRSRSRRTSRARWSTRCS